ncbi:hypothetical protein M9458_005328, partial [Cirrhinus mrigala]
QFNTLKDNLAKLTNKFDKVESFVDEIQAGNFPRPKLSMPPRLPVRRIPNQMPVKKSLANVPGKSVSWYLTDYSESGEAADQLTGSGDIIMTLF